AVMRSTLLLLFILGIASGDQVTVVNQCSYDLSMQGTILTNGQSRTAELDTNGLDVINSAGGNVMAKIVLDTTPNKMHFSGNLIIGKGNWNDAFVVLSNGASGTMGNDGSNNPVACTAAPTCIYDYLFPK
ncbi:hypothetical protein PENTCL1PPCAC_12187, partial [Pristionchus entomophagus]